MRSLFSTVAGRNSPPRAWLLFFLRSVFFLRLALLHFLLHVLGPRGDDADGTGIGDGLSQMLGAMADDEKKNSAFGILAAEPVHTFFQVGVGHGRNPLA